MPGWLVASEGKLTVAMDITVTEELRREGIARELVNRVQNLRKDNGLDVTDKISIKIEKVEAIEEAVADFGNYIATQTLAVGISMCDNLDGDKIFEEEFDDYKLRMCIEKVG